MENNHSIRRTTRIGIGIFGAILMLDGIVAPLYMHEMTTIRVHHLLHAGMAVCAGLLALILASLLPLRNREGTWWVIPAVLAPAVGLFLMWPSEYAYLMDHPWLHFLDHLGIALCSLLAVFAAQAYVRGLGWPMLLLLVAMDVGAAGGFGVSPGPSDLLSPQASAETPAMGASGMEGSTMAKPGVNSVQNLSLHIQGQTLSQTLGCTACHRIDGSRAVGPSWRNLAGYPQKLANGTTEIADYKFLTNAILYPEHLQLQGFQAGAMPSFYRSMLSGPQHTNEQQLNALVWYINSLSDRSSPATQPSVQDEPKK
jgi:cytochrome c553